MKIPKRSPSPGPSANVPVATPPMHPQTLLPGELWARAAHYLPDKAFAKLRCVHTFFRDLPTKADWINRTVKSYGPRPPSIPILNDELKRDAEAIFTERMQSLHRVRQSTRTRFPLTLAYDEDASCPYEGFRCETRMYGPAVGVTWSPDSRFVVTGASDGTAKIIDVCDGSSVLLRGHTECVNGAAWSPDNRTVVTVSADSSLRIWDAQTGAVVRTWESPDHEELLTVSWSYDGRFLSTTRDGHMGGTNSTVLDCASGAVVELEAAHEESVWSPRHNDIATVSGCTLTVLDMTAQITLTQTLGVESALEQPSWSPDGTRLLFVEPWTSVIVCTPNRPECRSSRCAESARWLDNDRVMIASFDGIFIWDTTQGDVNAAYSRVAKPIRGETPIGLTVSPDGRHVAMMTDTCKRTFKVWNAATDKFDASVDAGAPIMGMSWSHDLHFLAVRTTQSLLLWSTPA